MIYPHKAREDAHLDPTQRAEPATKEHLYAVSYLVFCEGHPFHMADTLTAKSFSLAKFMAMENCKDIFPECGGFLRHSVNVVQIREQLG